MTKTAKSKLNPSNGIIINKLTVIFFLLVSVISAGFIEAQVEPMQNYCIQPPFVGRVLHPNVLIIMDNSGSMGEKADSQTWDATRPHYGYFDETQWYEYVSGRFIPRAPKTDSKLPEYWDGAFLNWATMRRMDIVRKVLVGGKVDDRTPDGTFTLIGEPEEGSYNPSYITVNNAGNYVDQRQNDANVSAPNTGSFSNTSRTQTFSCVSIEEPAISATVSWNLTGSSGSSVTNCARVQLRSDDGSTVLIKDYGQANPGTFNMLSFYNAEGPGDYALIFTERNATGCSGTIAASNINMSIDADVLPTSASFQFRLTAGTNSSILRTRNVCGTNDKSVMVELYTEPLGIVQKTDPEIRFGLQFYNRTQGGKVVIPVQADNPTNFVTMIEDEPPGGNTPLGENIWTAIGYFARDTGSGSNGPRYTGTDGCGTNADNCYAVNSGTDPYNFGTAANPVLIPCAKSFVLLVTDGLPTSDLNLPSAIDNISTTYAGTCNDTNCTQTGTPLSSDCCLDNSTMAAHVLLTGTGSPKYADLRTDLAGDQYLTTYLVFAAFGAGGGGNSGIMAVAARNGGFEDLNGNFVPDLTTEYDRDGDGTPDTYFEAQDGGELESALTAALQDILRRAASATANSVIGAGKGQGANLLQSFFYPRKGIDDADLTWIGYLQNLWFEVDPLLRFTNIREDTNPDDELHLISPASGADDKIASIFFDTAAGDVRIRRFNDTTGDGLVDGIYGADLSFDELSPIWEAGTLLHQRDADSRTIWTSLDGAALTEFTKANVSSSFSLLQAADSTEADNIVDYTRGIDVAGARTRTATIGSTTGTWKLGDNINSTAKIQGAFPLNDYHQPQIYADSTYRQFINSNEYKKRGMVYAGGNDGMLHAFYLGKLVPVNDPARPKEVADLVSDPVGKVKGAEEWAYIPKNALPYLRYLMDPNYCHLYYVDAAPILFDASIGDSSVSAGNYFDVEKETVIDDNGTTDPTDDTLVSSTWRTIVIGSMGLGGGCGCTGTNCSPQAVAADHGLSSYFALDVTDPFNPQLLWEFSHAELGFTTSEPAIIKISATTGGVPDRSKNGHWFAVFASGPTGDVETVSHQFRGKSGQNLKLFVVNLKDGTLERVIDTGVTDAFAGSFGGVIDTDVDYQDEVAYVGYTTLNGSVWNQGGVLRLLTKDSSDPDDWAVVPLIQNVGPVTARVTALTADVRRTLWLYFGTGRYFFKDSSGNIDDSDTQRRLFGIKDPCFDSDQQKIDPTCSASDVVAIADLTDSTTAVGTTFDRGWFINLDASVGADKAERVITSPEVSTLGVVFFTTFSPSADPCTFGGKTFIWATKFDTGGSGAGFLYGRALMQTSTGAIEQKDLQTAFTERTATNESVGRRTAAFLGQPPRESGPLVLTPPPMKRILRIKER